jgi:hypothetical protein
MNSSCWSYGGPEPDWPDVPFNSDLQTSALRSSTCDWKARPLLRIRYGKAQFRLRLRYGLRQRQVFARAGLVAA